MLERDGGNGKGGNIKPRPTMLDRHCEETVLI